MRTRSVILGCVLALTADGATAVTTTLPATQPSATTQPADPAALVRQLGADRAKARNEAMAALRKMGRAALPALKAAANDDDAQVRASVQTLVAEIEHPQSQQAARPPVNPPDELNGPFGGVGGIIRGPGGGIIRVGPGGALRINGGARLQVSVTNVNGAVTRDVRATENGRDVHVREEPNGVTVDVTENGETKNYKAATPAELKEKEPEGYAYYEKYIKVGGVQVNPLR